MVLFSSRARQGTASVALGGAAAPTLTISSSAAFTDEWLAGSSRYHSAHTAHQISPTAPNIANAPRHPSQPIRAPAIGGASAPPDLAPIHMMPFARPRSWMGNQRDNARESVGNAPASAAPNTVRVASSVAKLRANPVRIVKTDQQPTMRKSIRRWPHRSPSQDVGISNTAYAT